LSHDFSFELSHRLVKVKIFAIQKMGWAGLAWSLERIEFDGFWSGLD